MTLSTLIVILISGEFIFETTCELFSTDPDIKYDVPDFLLSRGFKYEYHETTTDDGYILGMHRIINPYIPRTKCKPKPVVLWHGIMGNSEQFLYSRTGHLNSNAIYSEDNNTVINNCNSKLTSTLGYTLAACGYDVWLANSRGNQYSSKHLNLKQLDPKYWDFTLVDQGLYDVPAVVKKILKITRKKSLSYVGLSMGSTQMFILLSLRPDFEQYIKPFIALAPIAYLGNTASVVKVLAPIEPVVRPFTIGLGLPVPVAEFLGKFICANVAIKPICVQARNMVFGTDPVNTDLARQPAYFGNGFDFTSSRILLHYAQLINNNKFTHFDYGPEQNMIYYNSKTAPDIPLHNITSRNIVMIHGLNDILGDVTDAKRTAQSIPHLRELKTVTFPLWTHLDFNEGIYQNIFVNNFVLKWLRIYEKIK